MIPLQTVDISTHSKVNSPYTSGSTECHSFFNLKGAIGESVPVEKPKLIAEAAAENEALSRAIEEDFALIVTHHSLSQHPNSEDSTKDSVETIRSF